jgi:hypothetical protein
VSLVKLDSFPFFSTKSRKNQLLQKKITIFSIDQCFPFGLKFFFSSQASSHRSILIFRMKKNSKKIMSSCLLLLVPLCLPQLLFAIQIMLRDFEPKSACKQKRLLILDTPGHVDSENIKFCQFYTHFMNLNHVLKKVGRASSGNLFSIWFYPETRNTRPPVSNPIM